MPSQTWNTLRHEIGRVAGGYYGLFNTTTDITTSTVIVSTELSARFPQDDLFIGWYVMVEDSGSNNNGAIRIVTDYVGSSGTLTCAGANFSADTGAQEFGLYRRHPSDIMRSYNRVRSDLFPSIGSVIDDITLTSGQIGGRYVVPSTIIRRPHRVMIGRRASTDSFSENLLSNPGFEDWTAGVPDNWTFTSNGTETITQEQQTTNPSNYLVLDGASSARVFTPSGQNTVLSQAVTPSVATEKIEYQVAMWVYSIVASIIHLDTTTTLITPATHTGQGWELLRTSGTTSHTGSSLTIAVGSVTATATNSVFYADEAMLLAGQLSDFDIDWQPILNWKWRPPAGTTSTALIEFPYPIPEKHALRIQGIDVLSSVSADTSTVEVATYHIPIIAEKVAADLIREEGRQRSDPRERRQLLGEALEAEASVAQMLAQSGIQMPPADILIPDWSL